MIGVQSINIYPSKALSTSLLMDFNIIQGFGKLINGIFYKIYAGGKDMIEVDTHYKQLQ